MTIKSPYGTSTDGSDSLFKLQFNTSTAIPLYITKTSRMVVNGFVLSATIADLKPVPETEYAYRCENGVHIWEPKTWMKG